MVQQVAINEYASISAISAPHDPVVENVAALDDHLVQRHHSHVASLASPRAIRYNGTRRSECLS